MSKNCRGSIEHGTGCNLCGKCFSELARLKRENRIPKPKVDELNLNAWESAASDPELIEIVRLARVGLWAEKHSVAIDCGLEFGSHDARPVIAEQYTVARDSRPKR